jgi:hypothetical protein
LFARSFDGLMIAVSIDADLAGFRPLRHRDHQLEHSVAIRGTDLVQIEVVTEDQLSAENTSGSLGCHQLAGCFAHRSVSAYGQNVALDIEVNGVRVHPRQIEFHDEGIASRHASIGMNAGRAAVPKTCWLSRSSSRNGSVRINTMSHLLRSNESKV